MLSSDSSEEEIRDSGRSFQSQIVLGKKLYRTTKTKVLNFISLLKLFLSFDYSDSDVSVREISR